MTRAGGALATGLLLQLAVAAPAASAADRLPGYGLDTSRTSVSGVSSGGYMAVQFHVAHSGRVKGVGVVAGGPYYCARGSVWRATYACTTPTAWAPMPSPATLARVTDELAAAGRIDATAHLADARVWLFSGRRDRTVTLPVVEALRQYYRTYVPATSIVLVDAIDAGHGMVTTDAGHACATTAPPFLNDCDYDAAGELLAHSHGAGLAPGTGRDGRLLAFDQREFAGGDAYAISLADAGFVYVPTACATERCRPHVAFHGCRQSAESVGEAFVAQAGYNRWAERHRLVVLYPQTVRRYGWGVAAPGRVTFNPRGCWDWWGYTGADYHTRAAPQIRAARAMLERLGRPRG